VPREGGAEVDGNGNGLVERGDEILVLLGLVSPSFHSVGAFASNIYISPPRKPPHPLYALDIPLVPSFTPPLQSECR
jgi:hypothetical protein